MSNKLYCLWDTYAEEAGPIFEARNDFIARRTFNSMPPDSLPNGAKLKDFRLYKLGAYNRGDGDRKPYVTAFEKAYDITKEDKFSSYEIETEQKEEVNEAVS